MVNVSLPPLPSGGIYDRFFLFDSRTRQSVGRRMYIFARRGQPCRETGRTLLDCYEVASDLIESMEPTVKRPTDLIGAVNTDEYRMTLQLHRTVFTTTDVDAFARRKQLKECGSAVAILGFVRFTKYHYLLVASEARTAAVLGPHTVYGISATRLIELSSEATTGLRVDETRLRDLFLGVDLTKGFLFSPTLDLSNTLQRLALDPQAARRTKFAWNESLVAPMEDAMPAFAQRRFFTRINRGTAVQRLVSVAGRVFSVTLLTRSSKHFAGMRYLKRGVTEEGRAANHVEVEQVVLDESTTASPDGSCSFSSYVQMRGSVPIPWGHENVLAPKPPIILRQVDQSFRSTQLHFEELLTDFGAPVYILNLLKQHEKKPREQALSRQYFAAVTEILAAGGVHEEEAGPLRYTEFDLRNNASDAWNAMTGFAEAALRAQDVLCVVRGHLESTQTGVVRSNCVDCIDRTNFGQCFIATHVLGMQMYRLGAVPAPCVAQCQALRELVLQMFMEVGDRIAVDYLGSQTVSAGVVSRGGVLWDKRMGVQRFFSNQFLDEERQLATIIFTGLYPMGRRLTEAAMLRVKPPPDDLSPDSVQISQPLQAEILETLTPTPPEQASGGGLFGAFKRTFLPEKTISENTWLRPVPVWALDSDYYLHLRHREAGAAVERGSNSEWWKAPILVFERTRAVRGSSDLDSGCATPFGTPSQTSEARGLGTTQTSDGVGRRYRQRGRRSAFWWLQLEPAPPVLTILDPADVTPFVTAQRIAALKARLSLPPVKATSESVGWGRFADVPAPSDAQTRFVRREEVRCKILCDPEAEFRMLEAHPFTAAQARLDNAEAMLASWDVDACMRPYNMMAQQAYGSPQWALGGVDYSHLGLLQMSLDAFRDVAGRRLAPDTIEAAIATAARSGVEALASAVGPLGFLINAAEQRALREWANAALAVRLPVPTVMPCEAAAHALIEAAEQEAAELRFVHAHPISNFALSRPHSRAELYRFVRRVVHAAVVRVEEGGVRRETAVRFLPNPGGKKGTRPPNHVIVVGAFSLLDWIVWVRANAAALGLRLDIAAESRAQQQRRALPQVADAVGATELLVVLMREGVIVPVVGYHQPDAVAARLRAHLTDPAQLYTFYCSDDVLNATDVAPAPAPGIETDPAAVVRRSRECLRDERAGRHDDTVVGRLLGCSLERLLPAERACVLINVYNLFYLRVRRLVCDRPNVPAWVMRRIEHRTSVNIGGVALSLADIRHGLLRGNAAAPDCLLPQFEDDDARLALAPEPHPHYALMLACTYDAYDFDEGVAGPVAETVDTSSDEDDGPEGSPRPASDALNLPGKSATPARGRWGWLGAWGGVAATPTDTMLGSIKDVGPETLASEMRGAASWTHKVLSQLAAMDEADGSLDAARLAQHQIAERVARSLSRLPEWSHAEGERGDSARPIAVILKILRS